MSTWMLTSHPTPVKWLKTPSYGGVLVETNPRSLHFPDMAGREPGVPVGRFQHSHAQNHIRRHICPMLARPSPCSNTAKTSVRCPLVFTKPNAYCISSVDSALAGQTNAYVSTTRNTALDPGNTIKGSRCMSDVYRRSHGAFEFDALGSPQLQQHKPSSSHGLPVVSIYALVSAKSHGRPSRAAVDKFAAQGAFGVMTDTFPRVCFRSNPLSLPGGATTAIFYLQPRFSLIKHYSSRLICELSCVHVCMCRLFFIERWMRSSGARVFGPDAAPVRGDSESNKEPVG
ncbi:hypothetical protein LX36DRAFT_382165 [Colletotrichum falcatum]|nr:hypothetical protein LX36DRAFT_382165 [Colletotrichum falcatum]